jgi:hypothetical protein
VNKSRDWMLWCVGALVVAATVVGHFKNEIHSRCADSGLCAAFRVGEIEVKMKAGWIGKEVGLSEFPMLRFTKKLDDGSPAIIAFGINSELSRSKNIALTPKAFRWGNALVTQSVNLQGAAFPTNVPLMKDSVTLLMPDLDLVIVSTVPDIENEIQELNKTSVSRKGKAQ